MSFKLIKKTQAVSPKNPFVVLYGQPGCGKTSLSFTMPKPILHLDFDNGISRAVQKIRPDYFEVKSYGDFQKYVFSEGFEELVNIEGYKSVILDTIGTLLDNYITPWLIEKDPRNGTATGGLSLQGWGALSIAFNQLKTRLESLGLEICAVCHGREEGDGNNKQIRLDVKGGSSQIIYRSCDMLGYVYIKGSKRAIDFNPTATHIGKNVARLPVSYIPDASSQSYDDWLKVNVVDKCIENMREASLAQVAFNEALESWTELLESRKSPGDFDEFIKQVTELEDETLRIHIKPLLAKALDDKKLKYNPEKKKVEKIKPPKKKKEDQDKDPEEGQATEDTNPEGKGEEVKEENTATNES